ncbi:hypothetical protein MRB53_006301 [Persea americana]|uniref:Uncharacterized protein n=1 Tax=Persea americana TaxID=3435 RepID=A0ACC2MGB0_PERAE|nr:hypothetical protein MRB53_006301 [Persea americana]
MKAFTLQSSLESNSNPMAFLGDFRVDQKDKFIRFFSSQLQRVVESNYWTTMGPKADPRDFDMDLVMLTVQEDDDEEEIEDMVIKPTDVVIVCARNEDDDLSGGVDCEFHFDIRHD